MISKVKMGILFFALGFFVTGLIAGCGRDKSALDLPESEMRQLEMKESGTAERAAIGQKPAENPSVGSRRFYVYAEKGYFRNNFVPSGWMGDFGDIRFSDGSRENPYSRRTCIKIVYTARGQQGAGWAGMYWQEPANNWGNLPGGFNLTGMKKLTFFARGEEGGEIISEFKMGGILGENSDSTSVSIGPIVLTPEWEQYTIDLENEDLSNVIGGFAFVIGSMENPEGATFFIDEILYE